MTQLPPDEPPEDPPATAPHDESPGSSPPTPPATPPSAAPPAPPSAPPPPPPPAPPPPPNGPPSGWVPGATTVPPATMAPAPGYVVPPQTSASDRVRMAWQRRHDTDYIFDFWTAFGWTVLSCGFYGFYVLYQLVRRDRDHNLRRIELLDAATTYAWEQASARGLAEEMQPAFERVSMNMAALRAQTTQFRDPIIWVILDVIAGGIARIVAYCLIDGDLVTHDHAEGAIEAELSVIYGRLGAPVPPPDPARLKGRQNYVARIIVTIVTCGIYSLWWLYDLMVDGNRHFEHNWRWEDGLASSVQSMLPAQGV